MGCGTSRPDVIISTAPAAEPPAPQSIPASGEQLHSSDTKNKNAQTESIAKSAQSHTAPKALSKPVIPSIPSESTKNSVAFEIPLDGLTNTRPSNHLDSASALAPAPTTKLSLPKLQLSEKDIKAKLANTEARWKVRDQIDRLLDGDLDQALDTRRRKRGDKPQLASQKRSSDPEKLMRRLKEKEEAAAINRQREIEKLQAKLARQEEHARRVQERKRALGGGSNEELRLSWGGEKGLAEAAGVANDSNESPASSGRPSRSSAGSKNDADSGKGSSSASISYGNSSRGGSGRSTNTDTTDVGEDVSLSASPVTQIAKKSADINVPSKNKAQEIPVPSNQPIAV